MIRAARVAVCLLAMATTSSRAAAQTASINAVATITSVALTVATLADLDFQQVSPGVPKFVDPTSSPDAGLFEVHGARNAEFSMSFVTPGSLINGIHAMPIAFGPGSGCAASVSLGSRNSCTVFDPAVAFIERFPSNGSPANRRWFVWLGGTVSPTAVQNPGSYSAPITLTVSYTGN